MADNWISDETEVKEQHFRGILKMHVDVCKGIFRRWPSRPYLYADLYAGPGHLEHRGRHFDGSPLIARDILTRAGVAYEAVHFEKDPEVAARLEVALQDPADLLGITNPGSQPVFKSPCQEAFPGWVEQNGYQGDRYGLVYADPINDEIPHELFSAAARYMPRVDLLSYVAATQYKRRRGVDSGRPFLLDHVRAVGKRVVLIRRPHTAWHWTFIVWSNWVDFPEWQKQGFYRLDSEVGRQIMDQLNLSSREHHAKANTPLPLGEPPYKSYAEYLRHPEFLAVRKVVFERAAGKCERCGLRPPTEPHHLKYPPWGEFDVPENMVAVCHRCHCDFHGKAA